ncbi:MAG: type ISP restriction/modification enzyme, partial [Dolichospermum sp.]
KCISWTRGLKKRLSKNEKLDLEEESIKIAIYRPFCKQRIYFNSDFNERPGQISKIFPNQNVENLVICVTGRGATKEFSALITNTIPNLHFHDTSQCFPLYTYEK